MTYTYSTPTNLSDPDLNDWSEPVTIVDGRVDGVQPHTPSFDDLTHAWQDPEDIATNTWRFAGQTTVCKTTACNSHADGDRPTYLQLFASKSGSDWSKGFNALGDLFPYEPDGESDAGILNVPDFWKKEETGWPYDFLHFGANVYWLGNYTRSGRGANQTRFVPATPQQAFGPGPAEGHGYFSKSLQTFVWWGWVNGRPPREAGVAAWDSMLSVARAVSYDGGLSTVGDFNGMLRFYPVSTLALLRGRLLVDSRDALGRTAPGHSQSFFPLKAAAGRLLDIEINITWPDAEAVPIDFGSVGISVRGKGMPFHAGGKGAETGAVKDASSGGTSAAPPEVARFDSTEHGGLVTATWNAAGSLASWGPVTGDPAGSCNQVAFIDGGSSDYWLQLDPAGIGGGHSQWIDYGWCSKSVGYQGGASWKGPAPQWLGYQGPGKAWLYRALGLFKTSSDPPASPNAPPNQGVAYGKPFKAGQNVSATRNATHLEFFVDGESQGKLPLGESGMPDDVVGCVAVCGGGSIATGTFPFPPSPPPTPPPPPPPAPTPGLGYEVLISSGIRGSFALNGVPLAPAGSSRPRPAMLTLRVLVDSSSVEAFAQGGRATTAQMLFAEGDVTGLVWTGGASAAAVPPFFSVKIWEMNSAWV